MSEKQRDVNSIFVGKAAIIILFVLCIVSAYMHLDSLMVFLLALFLIALFSRIWGRHSLRNLKLETKIGQSNIFPGEDIDMTIHVTNQKMLPMLWLETEYFQNPPSFLSSEEDFKKKFTWIMAWQTASWDVIMHAKKRGITSIEAFTLSSGDGFGLSGQTSVIDLKDKKLIVVYPRIFPVDVSNLICNTTELHPGERGYIEDNTLFRGSRDYQSGDSSRFVNWRVLAKQGQLLINQYDPVVPEFVTFILDLKSFTKWKQQATVGGMELKMIEFNEDMMEDMISLVASCVVALTEKRIRCSLIIPSIAQAEQIMEASVDLEEQYPRLLTALAGLEYHGEHTYFDTSMILQNNSFGQVYVVCQNSSTITCRNLLDRLQDQRVNILARQEGSNDNGMRTVTYDILRRHDV